MWTRQAGPRTAVATELVSASTVSDLAAVVAAASTAAVPSSFAEKSERSILLPHNERLRAVSRSSAVDDCAAVSLASRSPPSPAPPPAVVAQSLSLSDVAPIAPPIHHTAAAITTEASLSTSGRDESSAEANFADLLVTGQAGNSNTPMREQRHSSRPSTPATSRRTSTSTPRSRSARSGPSRCGSSRSRRSAPPARRRRREHEPRPGHPPRKPTSPFLSFFFCACVVRSQVRSLGVLIVSTA